MEERNSILDKLNRPQNWNGWELKDASEDLKRDIEIVMAAVTQYVKALQFASKGSSERQGDRDGCSKGVWGCT